MPENIPNGQETTLRLDPNSGFMTSPRSDRITVNQKQMIVSYYAQKGNMTEACAFAGVAPRSFRQARAADPELDRVIRECELGFVERAKGYMIEHMARPGNYMDRVTIARRFEPGVWGDQVNHNVTHSVEIVSKLYDKAIETEATPTECLNGGGGHVNTIEVDGTMKNHGNNVNKGTIPHPPTPSQAQAPRPTAPDKKDPENKKEDW